MDEEGVWDRHLQVDFKPRDGFYVSAQANALATVNSQPFRETRLRNGDCLEIGALKMRFWLGQTRQVGLRFREWLTWAAIAGICLAQIALIYWLGASTQRSTSSGRTSRHSSLSSQTTAA